jgi:hypothetical protein
VSGGFYRGSVAPTPTTADLNFASQSYSGCASLTACITTTRASPETCTDSAGALTYVTNNVACVTDLGLAAYQGATNLLIRSNDISDGNYGTYTTGGGTIAKTANSSVAPDGTTTATLVTLNVTAGEAIAAQGFSTTAADYTGSCYIKAFAGDAGKRITLYMVDAGFADYAWTVVTLPTTWARFRTARTGANTLGFGFLGAAGGTFQTGQTKFYIWGCQAELGNLLTPSPLVRTTAAAATRAPTEHQATGPLAAMLNGSQGSAVFTTNRSLASAAATLLHANGSLVVGKTAGNTLTSVGGATLSTANTGTWTAPSAAGIAWDSFGRSLQLFRNGAFVNDGNGLVGGAPVRFGSTGGTTAFFNGYLKRLQAWNSRLTNGQLAAAIPDVLFPTVAVTAPTGGSVSGSTVTVSASASDDVAVASVQFTLDGSNLGSADTVAPYTLVWDSTAVGNGSHTIGASATDTSGNVTVATSVTVNVSNGAGVSYFFASSGSDTANNCTVSATPCQTISKANGITYQAGDSMLFKRGDTFTGCVDVDGARWFGTLATPGTVGAYSSGTAPIINGNCTGETGVIRIHEASGVTVQDLDIRAPNIPTPRGGIMIQNNSASPTAGITIQRNLIGGIRYYESTRPINAANQGFNGANIYSELYPGAGFNNISVLNNTICGLPAGDATNGDDAGRAGFGNEAIKIANELWQGNIICNMSGGPGDITVNQLTYSPMGLGIELNAMNGPLVEFNIVHDGGYNFWGCGGPAGIMTFATSNAIMQFNEVYANQPKPTRYFSGGQCDFLGFDFDNTTTNGLAQYNYSHDNWGSGFYHFNSIGIGWTNNTYRYSISENDTRGGALSIGALNISVNQSSSVLYIYNMTTYNNQVYSGVAFATYNQGATALSFYPASGTTGAVANNLMATSKDIGNLCDFVVNNSAGFSTALPLHNNRYHCLNGSNLNWRYANLAYTTLASFQAATGKDANSTTGDPSWGSTRPVGTCSWTPNLSNGPQSCPAGYHLSTGSAPIGIGANINSVYGVTVGTRDYYGNALSNGVGSGFNVGADGAAH